MKTWPLITTALFSVAFASEDLFSNWFESQENEIIDEPLHLKVVGELPSYINGNLVRVGPSLLGATDNKSYTNFLDSFGRASSWQLRGKDGTASFMSTIIKSNLWNASVEDNTIARHITQQFTDPPTDTGFFELSWMDNTDVNVYRFADSNKFLTFTDFYLMNEVDFKTLRTLGTVSLNQTGDDVPKGTFFSSSHPGEHINAETGEVELVNWIGAEKLGGSTIYIYRMGKDMVRKVVGSVDIDFLPYSIHSIAVTGDYAIVVLGHVSLDFLRTGINLCLSCNAHSSLETEPTQIFVFSLAPGARQGVDVGPIATMTVDAPDAFFINHFINAFTKTENVTAVASSSSSMKRVTGQVEGEVDIQQERAVGEGSEEAEEVLVLDMCAHYSMDGLLGEHVLGDLADVLDPDVRDSMPYNCDAVKRLEISVARQAVLSNVDLPVVDELGNSYHIELATVSPLKYGMHSATARANYRTARAGADAGPGTDAGAMRQDKPYCFAYAGTYHALGSERYEDMAVLKIDLCRAAEQARSRSAAAAAAAAAGSTDNSDVETIATVVVWHQEGVYLGEPIFVPDPSAPEVEDAGVLLVVSLEGASHTTRLLIIDAQTMQKIGHIDAPFPLMFEFHGQFFPV